MNYHHGVSVIEINEGTRPIRTVSSAVIGLPATSLVKSFTIYGWPTMDWTVPFPRRLASLQDYGSWQHM